jgi:hypothetical protein
LPLDCGKAEKKTHDYVRHGTANLFAALNVETGEVFGECRPTRTGQDFLDFLNKAVQLHVDKEIHVVLDNLSAHTTPEVLAWLEKNPHVMFHFTPVGSRGSTRSRSGPGSLPARRSGVEPSLGAHPHPTNNRLHQHVARRPEALQLGRNRRRDPRQGQSR